MLSRPLALHYCHGIWSVHPVAGGWWLGYIYIHCNLYNIALSWSLSLTLYPELTAAGVARQCSGHTSPPAMFRKCMFIETECGVLTLVNCSLKLLYIHLESTWFSIRLKLCSVFPTIASLTKLHYFFLKPCLYLLCFNVIFISSSDLWIMEICTLGENCYRVSVARMFTSSLYSEVNGYIQSQPCSPRCTVTSC